LTVINVVSRFVQPDRNGQEHSYTCVYDVERSGDIETAGLPCTDMSSAHLGRQFHEGKTAAVFICHAKQHIKKKTKLVILENVWDCHTQLKTLINSLRLVAVFVAHCDTPASSAGPVLANDSAAVWQVLSHTHHLLGLQRPRS
jgi:hypothetical protein